MDASAHGRERERDQGGRQRRFYTPDASPLRQEIERRSAPLLVALRQAPRWLLSLIPVGLLLAGLAAPSIIGGLAMLVLVVVLGWLGYLSWPSLSISARLLRTVALLVLGGLAALRLVGRI